jgi:quercetin dioxygenase-like cupin family protein
VSSFQLDNLSSRELFKDVLIGLVNGDELTLNYFELKSQAVTIPFHDHPVEHLVIVLEGELEFLFEGRELALRKGSGFFLPAKTRHSARVVRGPVRALEIYAVAEDEYYER